MRRLNPFDISIEKLIVLAVTLLAFALRAYRLEAQSYWIDEAWTLFYGHQSLGELWYYLRTIRAAPPLYHVLTIYWIQLAGDGEYALRFLSLLFSVIAVPLTYRLGKSLGDVRLGVIAALLMAVSPYQIWHAQDARNYAMLTAASVMSMWSFFKLWRGGGWRWWLIYILSTEWAVLTHYHGLVVIGVQGLFFLLTWQRHWRYYLPWAGTLLVILGPFAAWLFFGSTLWQSEHWLPFVPLWESYVRSTIAYSVGELAPRPQAIIPALVFLLFYGLGLIYAARRSWRDWRGLDMVAFLLAYTLAPNVAIWLYSQVGTPVYLERYLIPVQVGYLLAVAMGILAVGDAAQHQITKLKLTKKAASTHPTAAAPLAGRPINLLLSLCLTLVLAGISAWILSHHYHDPAYAKPNWRGVIETIENLSLPGDAILMTGDGGEKLFDYYYRGDLPVYDDFNTPVPPPAEVRQRLTEIAARHERLWYTPYGVEIDATLEDWLARNAYPAWQRWLGRKRLALYGLQSPSPNDSTKGVPPDELASSLATKSEKDGQNPLLKGVSMADGPTPAGDLLPLTLIWQADTPPAEDYQLSLRLINHQGDVFTQSDWPPLTAAQPASTWPPNRPVADRRSLWIPFDTPPGDYLLQLVLYHPETGQSLGRPMTIEGVALDPTVRNVPLEALSIPNLEARPLGELSLVGFTVPEIIQPGQEMWLWLYWQAQQSPDPETIVRLRLTTKDAAGVTADFPLPGTQLEAWQPGQVRRAVYHMPTSPRLTGQAVAVSVALINAAEQIVAETPLTTVQLDSRERRFQAPEMTNRIETTFGDPPLITLLGFDLAGGNGQMTSQPLDLMLYWQAEAEMDATYTVFVQLLNEAGQVIAQVDLQPQAGAAATTTWLPGEILADPYTLPLPADLPSGDYRLITGFYDAATGQRLPVASGGDFVELTQVPVQ